MIDESVLDKMTDDKFRSVCEEVVNEMNRLPIPGAVAGVSDEEWVITTVDGTKMIGHGGATHGQNSLLRGEFLRHPDNSIVWLRLGGRIHARQA